MDLTTLLMLKIQISALGNFVRGTTLTVFPNLIFEFLPAQ